MIKTGKFIVFFCILLGNIDCCVSGNVFSCFGLLFRYPDDVMRRVLEDARRTPSYPVIEDLPDDFEAYAQYEGGQEPALSPEAPEESMSSASFPLTLSSSSSSSSSFPRTLMNTPASLRQPGNLRDSLLFYLGELYIRDRTILTRVAYRSGETRESHVVRIPSLINQLFNSSASRYFHPRNLLMGYLRRSPRPPSSLEELSQLLRARGTNSPDNWFVKFVEEQGYLLSDERLRKHKNQPYFVKNRTSLMTVPRSIDSLRSLSTLSLVNNPLLTFLPLDLALLNNLRILTLDDNGLQHFSLVQGALPNLEELSLRDNSLREISGSIGSLSRLQILVLSGNNLIGVPATLGYLRQLRQLDLDNNNLLTLPDSIGWLSHLEALNISGNQLGELPTTIGALTSLTTLRADHNFLEFLPPSISSLNSLTWLSSNFNNLSTLPRGMRELSRLQRLCLNDNSFSSMPPAILELSQLSSLNMDGNTLRSLPSNLSRLTSLRTLRIGRNQLEELPDTIGSLGLRYLYLEKNVLSALPSSLTRLSLSILELTGNPLSAPVLLALREFFRDVLRYAPYKGR